MPTSLLEGKVAQILNDRELVINIGANKGVLEGMRFAVIGPEFEVVDPDSQAILGTVDREKVRVEAIEVQERLTICATYQTRTVGGGLGDICLATFKDVFSPRRRIPVTLKSSDVDMPAPLSPEESYVKIGDRVKQLSDDPADEG